MNLFKVPLGNVGKSFVAELSRLYNAFASGSALESIVLIAAIGCYMAVPVFEREKNCVTWILSYACVIEWPL